MTQKETLPSWPLDLMLNLDDGAALNTLRARVANALRNAIRTGLLVDGQRLPATRQLAEQLNCSRSVIVAVYRQLGMEGLVVPAQGSGTLVRAPRNTAVAREKRPAPPPRFTFTPGASDLGSFPRTAWRRAIGDVTSTVSKDQFYYADPAGAHQLRRILSERLFLQRRVTVAPDNLHICSGTVQAVRLLAHALKTQGAARVAVENPGWTRLRPPLEAEGLIPVPISVDQDGLCVDELEEQKNIGAVIVSAAHHFPTGAAMSGLRREALLSWAKQHEAVIIEDDYDAEFRAGVFEQQSLQSQNPDRVAYLGTTSKTLSPAMRLSWMALPENLSNLVGQIRPAFDLGVSVIDQLALANLMETGVLDRHIRKSRQHNDRKRTFLAGTIRTVIPEAHVSSLKGGLYVTMTLPPGLSEKWIISAAAERSMTVFGLQRYRWVESPRWDYPPTLVLGFANMSEDRTQEAVAILAEICRDGMNSNI